MLPWKPKGAVHCDTFRYPLLLSALNTNLPACSGIAVDSVCLVLKFIHWNTCCTRVLYETARGQCRVIAVYHETERCKCVTYFLPECDAVSFPGTCCVFLRNGNSYPHGVSNQKKEVLIPEQFAKLPVAVHMTVFWRHTVSTQSLNYVSLCFDLLSALCHKLAAHSAFLHPTKCNTQSVQNLSSSSEHGNYRLCL